MHFAVATLMTEARLSEIFGELRASLVPVIAKILAAPKLEHPKALTEEKFPEDKQEEFCRAVATKMGFSFDAGRFDRSVHPFTGGAGQGFIENKHSTDVCSPPLPRAYA
jgi:carboxypeptidase Taq